MEDAAVSEFHRAIITLAAEKLGRDLTDKESRFITSRGGYIVLEAIHDTVATGSRENIERYLNSE